MYIDFSVFNYSQKKDQVKFLGDIMRKDDLQKLTPKDKVNGGGENRE